VFIYLFYDINSKHVDICENQTEMTIRALNVVMHNKNVKLTACWVSWIAAEAVTALQY